MDQIDKITIIIASISLFFALISLFISWMNYRTQFKPFLSVIIHSSLPHEYCPFLVIKNSGNSVAHKIRMILKTSNGIEKLWLSDIGANEDYTLNLAEWGYDFHSKEFQKIILKYKDIRNFPYRKRFTKSNKKINWEEFWESSAPIDISKGVSETKEKDKEEISGINKNNTT